MIQGIRFKGSLNLYLVQADLAGQSEILEAHGHRLL